MRKEIYIGVIISLTVLTFSWLAYAETVQAQSEPVEYKDFQQLNESSINPDYLSVVEICKYDIVVLVYNDTINPIQFVHSWKGTTAVQERCG